MVALNKYMASWSKSVDELWGNYLEQLLLKPRKSWKKIIQWMDQRRKLLKFRKEKWLQKIFRLTISMLNVRERYWLHQFRTTVANDPTMWYKKPPQKGRTQIKDRDWKRIGLIRE